MKEEIVNERQCETEDEKIDIQQLLTNNHKDIYKMKTSSK